MDEWLMNFAKDNMISIGLGLGGLKIIAVETKCVADDKIVQLLTSFFKR